MRVRICTRVYMSCRSRHPMLKMTPKVRRLTAQLRVARWRVRRLEMMLILSRRVAVARCEHDWEKVYPRGPRDNGEFVYVCKICGKTE